MRWPQQTDGAAAAAAAAADSRLGGACKNGVDLITSLYLALKDAVGDCPESLNLQGDCSSNQSTLTLESCLG